MFKVMLRIALTLLAVCLLDDVQAQKLRLEDLQVITLHDNKMASSRRYSQPIPQLVCVGGSAGCNVFTPKVVQCKNEGWDGTSIQWECKADMPDSYSFGVISVVCEGFDYPEDPYILKGSCSLEYTLERSSKEFQSKRKSSNYKTTSQNSTENHLSALPIVVALVILGYIIYSKFLSRNVGPRQFERPSEPDIGWNIPSSDNGDSSTYEGFTMPPFNSPGAKYYQCGFREHRANQAAVGGGGFWTGFGAGGLLGYMFGNQRRDSRPPSYSAGFRHANEDNLDDDSSNSKRTATAYGGTKRR